MMGTGARLISEMNHQIMDHLGHWDWSQRHAQDVQTCIHAI